FDLIARLVGFGAHDLVSVDDRGALLAFANVGAHRKRLTEGHPGRRGEASAEGFRPKQQDVDAGIGRAVVAKRTGDGTSSGPGLRPRPDAGLQLVDDLVGDPGVDVRTSG